MGRKPQTLTFYSNYFNHHQRSLCDELFAILGEGFHFVETEPMEEFRREMGWGVNDMPPYVLRSYGSEEAGKLAAELAVSSDVVVMGTAPESILKERMNKDLLTFRYSERPLKEGRWKIFVPYLAKKFYVNHISNRGKRLYCLCAGAFVASDYLFLMGSYKDKCYRFGYFPFPEERSFEELRSLKEENKSTRILWCGRFLKLKRADLLIKAAASLKDKGYDFELVFAGNGAEEEHLHSMVESLGLTERTTFLGYLSPKDAREEMGKSDIFVCTSNKLEGWGSVIYEGLAAGCATVSTSAAGATPFLVKEGKTGLVYRSGNAKSLEEKLEILLKDREYAGRLGQEAYDQMHDLWNPATAAGRLLEVSEHLLSDEEFFFDEGPLSKAPVMYEDWYKG